MKTFYQLPVEFGNSRCSKNRHFEFSRRCSLRSDIRFRQAFSLIELVVVMLVVGIISTLILLGVSSARESARKLQCSNNLKQIGLALLNYEATHRVFPRGVQPNRSGPFVAILPYLEMSTLYDKIDFSKSIGSDPIVASTQVSTYRCPSTLARTAIRVDYGLNRGVSLAADRKSPWLIEEERHPKILEFTRGTQSTPLLAEICPIVEGVRVGGVLKLQDHDVSSDQLSQRFSNLCETMPWTADNHHYSNGEYWYGAGGANYYHILVPLSSSCANGGKIQKSLYSTTSMHVGGSYMLFADGHVDFQLGSVDRGVWNSLGSR